MRRPFWPAIVWGCAILAGIHATSFYNPLLAHTIVEFLCVTVAWSIFVFIWHSRFFLDTSYLVILGVGYLVTGAFDLGHILLYEGMNLVPGSSPALSAQWQFSGRLVEGISFVAAPLLVLRYIPLPAILMGFGFIGSALLMPLLLTDYPFHGAIAAALGVAVGPAGGVAIMVLFAASIPILLFNARRLGGPVVLFLTGSAVSTIISEIVLIAARPSGAAYMMGHQLKLASYYLIYRAIIMMGFIDPCSLLFSNLQQSRESEHLARERAERRAAELETLRANFTDIVSHLDLNQLLQIILERAIALLKATGGDLALYERDWGGMRIVASYNMGIVYIGSLIAIGEGPLGVAAQKREPLIIRNYGSWQGRSPSYHQLHWHSYMALPLIVRGRLFGTLGIVLSDPHRDFIASDLELIVLFAQQAAIAIENAQLYEEAKHQAEVDGLTGLANRRHFFELARLEVNRALRYGHPLTAIMFDIDKFKHVNDTFGHAVGDRVLINIASLCREHFRETDVIGRYGGEEFVLLLPETTLATAVEAGERLLDEIARTVVPLGEVNLTVTVSLGLAQFDPADPDLDLLLVQADKALYQAKREGGNRLCVFEHPKVGTRIEEPVTV